MSNHQKGITFQIQSRHQNVTGSSFFCTITFPNSEKFNFLVDAGLFQEKDYLFLNRHLDFKATNFEHIFITHNHSDHVGMLPSLVKNNFNGTIHTTSKTRALLPISLFDSAKIEKKYSYCSKLPPLYTSEDVLNTLQMITGHEFEESFKINDNVTATFFENGHSLGAALTLISSKFGEEELNILFTGDYNNHNFFFTPKKLPSTVRNLDNLIIVQESTYGSDTKKNKIGNFKEDVCEILESGKSIFIPCIAQERYEVVLATLKEMQEDGNLPISIPIYADSPLAHAYLEKYKKVYGTKFIPFGLELIDPLARNILPETTEQKIIISSSGMCNHGPSEFYLSKILSNSNWAIYFTCYQAQGTLGKELLDFYNELDAKKKKVNKKLKKDISCAERVKLEDSLKFLLKGVKYDLNASIYSTSEFSSHAGQAELISFLRQFKHISTILINHGEENVKEIYKTKLEDLQIADNVDILSREKYFVLDKSGIISKNNTKFIMTAPNEQEERISSDKRRSKKVRTKTRYSKVRIQVHKDIIRSYQMYYRNFHSMSR